MSFSVDKMISQAQYYTSAGRFLFRLLGPAVSHSDPHHDGGTPDFLKVPNIPRSIADGILCHQVTLPARGITTQDEYRHGPPRKIATQVNFGDLDASFYWMGANKEQGKNVHKFFNDWHNYIVGRVPDGTAGGYDQSSFYGPAYYDSYIMTADLRVYSPNSAGTEDPMATFKFFELYPLTLNPIQFSWDGTDTVLSFNISFTFRAWESV